MATSLEAVAEQALGLPATGRAMLVEKLLASLAGDVDEDVERAHLDQIQQRRADVRNGKAKLIDGLVGIAEVRAALRK